MYSNILLNTVLIMFPILVYFIFSCCNIFSSSSDSKVFLILNLITSLYFSLTYNINFSNSFLLFSNIPILVAYIRKEEKIAILLSLIVVIFYWIYDYNILIILSKYLIYYICYLFFSKRRELFISLVAIIQSIYLLVEYFWVSKSSFDNLLGMILITFLIYIITFLIIYLFDYVDKISTIYKDMQNYTNQEKIKNSLFKLTHEIKNPIAVCKGYLDMLDLNDENKIHKYIPIISSEIDRSLNIMNDFMDYSKIKLDMNIIDMTILFDEIYDSLNVLLFSKNIRFNYNNNYSEIYLNGDYDRLKQVFINIIKNSVESINRNGIIDFNVKVLRKRVIIEVVDNGIGMDKEKLKHIKEMFYTTKKNGTGLGVSLSNEIIMLHNGSISYKSIENVGTKCKIVLPIIGSDINE